MYNYKIVENYRDIEDLRNEFFLFTKAVFPHYDFQKWYNKGFWTDEYIPHSLLRDDKIISNVSVSQMKVILEGKETEAIQIGTVGTLNEYRNKGLSRVLMEHVLNKYGRKAYIFFLIANESVTDFYPRFGFRQLRESLFVDNSGLEGKHFSAVKLDVDSEVDFRVVKEILKKRLVLTRIFGAIDYGFITSWHLINIFAQDLFYLEDDGIIVIATEEDNQLHMWDIIFTKPFNVGKVIERVCRKGKISKIIYHFPPDIINFKYDEIITDEESIFFVKGDFIPESIKFKFPVTAQT